MQACRCRMIGVLYRSNYLSLPVQLALSKLNIPFAVYGGMKFIETAHVKDVLSFLKFHHNIKDEMSLSRILMLLDGIGPKTAEKIKDLIVRRRPGRMDIRRRGRDPEGLSRIPISKNRSRAWSSFSNR